MADSPTSNEVISFETQIKPLFRDKDRQSMSSRFDLWSHDSVSSHADAILRRLRDGTMPCDGAWEGSQIELFARWVDTGKQP